MKKKIALVYASHDGHTKKISKKIGDIITNNNIEFKLLHVNDFNICNIKKYNFIIFGSPIRYGKHLSEMVRFLNKNNHILDNQNTAFFSVNLTARKTNRDKPETNKYINKILKNMKWKPNIVAVFAGKLDYPRYNFLDKKIIQFIMFITKGPTDKNTTVEFTDWNKVNIFAKNIVNKVQ